MASATVMDIMTGTRKQLMTAQMRKKYKFAPKTRNGNNRFASYASVKEFVGNKIQKEYKNSSGIAKSFKEGRKMDFDGMEPDNNVKAIKQARLDIKYQEELR